MKTYEIINKDLNELKKELETADLRNLEKVKYYFTSVLDFLISSNRINNKLEELVIKSLDKLT